MPTPTPKKSKSNDDSKTPLVAMQLMDFYDALREVITGKKVTRQSWGTPDYMFMPNSDSLLHIYRDGQDHTLLLSLGDINGEDWYVIE